MYILEINFMAGRTGFKIDSNNTDSIMDRDINL